MYRHAGYTAVALSALLAAICSVAWGSATPSQTTGGTTPAPVTTPYNPSIDPANFGGPIDNPWLPLKPGTTFRYRGVGDYGKTR